MVVVLVGVDKFILIQVHALNGVLVGGRKKH